jgi:hypothetical protein
MQLSALLRIREKNIPLASLYILFPEGQPTYFIVERGLRGPKSARAITLIFL